MLWTSAFLFVSVPQANPKNPHNLPIVNTTKEYLNLVKKDSSRVLVDLEKFIPGIVLDVRYATTNNITKTVLYKQQRAFLLKPAAEKLKKVQEELAEEGLGLKIFDGYRPYAVTLLLWDAVRDDRYAASPDKGSRHNRGCAVDLTIVNLKTGTELEMPTPYDDFTEKAHLNYMKLPKQVLQNREKLINVMRKHGFETITSEWWHYDLKGWSAYPLLDLSFEELDPVHN